MKSSAWIGLVAGGMLAGAACAMAVHGDFSARNMKRMGRDVTRKARKMGINL